MFWSMIFTTFELHIVQYTNAQVFVNFVNQNIQRCEEARTLDWQIHNVLGSQRKFF